ncbi:unnamed protein product [Symbiodinium sp. KB8]|nr:unnamed protein product [Symbiodinium sp. KB8]
MPLQCIKSQQGDDWLIIGIIPAEEAEEAPRMTGSYGIKSKETYTDVRHPVSCRYIEVIADLDARVAKARFPGGQRKPLHRGARTCNNGTSGFVAGRVVSADSEFGDFAGAAFPGPWPALAVLREDALWQLPDCNIEVLEATQKLAERLENETMLSEFGKIEVRVGRGFFFHVQGQAEESLPLEDFVRSMPNDNYLFDFGEFMEQSGLSANWSLPPVLEQLGTYDTSSVPLRLALGSAGLLPLAAAGTEAMGNLCAREDDKNWRGRGFVPPQWECVSEPGDLLYVPEGFQHATASLGYSVAVVQQARRALPWSAVFHRHAAVQASREKQQKQAVKLARKAAKLDPTNSDLWLTLAQIHQGPDSDSATKMVKYCEKGLKANPLCGKTRLHLLMAYNSLGLAHKTQELMEETKSLGRELVETVDFLVQVKYDPSKKKVCPERGGGQIVVTSEAWAVSGKHVGCYTGGKIGFCESSNILGCFAGMLLLFKDSRILLSQSLWDFPGDASLHFRISGLCSEELHLVDAACQAPTRVVSQEGDGVLTFAIDRLGLHACTSHRIKGKSNNKNNRNNSKKNNSRQGEKVALVRSWRGHDQVVADVCFDTTGALVATGSVDQTAKVWDFQGYFCTHNFKGHAGIVTLVPAPEFGPTRVWPSCHLQGLASASNR